MLSPPASKADWYNFLQPARKIEFAVYHSIMNDKYAFSYGEVAYDMVLTEQSLKITCTLLDDNIYRRWVFEGTSLGCGVGSSRLSAADAFQIIKGCRELEPEFERYFTVSLPFTLYVDAGDKMLSIEKSNCIEDLKRVYCAVLEGQDIDLHDRFNAITGLHRARIEALEEANKRLESRLNKLARKHLATEELVKRVEYRVVGGSYDLSLEYRILTLEDAHHRLKKEVVNHISPLYEYKHHMQRFEATLALINGGNCGRLKHVG